MDRQASLLGTSWQRGLALLAVIRLLIALAFMLNILPLELRHGWYLYHQAGEEYIFALALSLARGEPIPSVVGIGQPLVMLPWIVLLKPDALPDIIVPLVLINGFLLGGLSVIVIGHLARHLTGREAVGLWTAGVWACLPLLAYCGFFWYTTPSPAMVRSTAVPELGWLNGLTDGPATFFVMLAAMLLARPLPTDSRHRDRHMAAFGAALSAAILFRVHIAPLVAVMLIVALTNWGRRALLIVCSAALLIYLPQLWYNMLVFRLPVTTGYLTLSDVKDWGGPFKRPLSDRLKTLYVSRDSLLYLWDLTIGAQPWLLAPLALMLLMIAQVALSLGRERGWRAVALLIGGPLAYVGFMASTWPFRADISRFLLPAFPFLTVLCVYALVLAVEQVEGLRRPRSA